MLTRDFSCHSKKGFFCLLRRDKCSSYCRGNFFLAGRCLISLKAQSKKMSYPRSWKNSRLQKRNIREKSCLRTGTLTDTKGFCENSRLGEGISEETPCFIRETNSQVKSLVSDIPAGSRERVMPFFSVHTVKKVSDILVFSRDATYQTRSGQE